MNHRELVKITTSYDEAVKWLQEKLVIPREKKCICRTKFNMIMLFKKEKFFWQCSRCDRSISIFTDTILYNSKLSITSNLDLIYFWSKDFKQNETAIEINTKSKNTCNNWYEKLQKLAYYIMKNEK
ncbi:hypothetical protein H311_05144, partial [Anncaliia algerae PRA109]